MGAYFTRADLQAIWESSVDPLYSQPFTEAGDGGGLEAYSQAFAQYERVSQAIVRSTQALYVLPHSGQLDEPAAGDARARVTLEISRSGSYQYPIVFEQGRVMVEEETTDHGHDAGVRVLTGRRYVMATTVVFEPGQVGPKLQPCDAEYPGYSWNNPEPDSITSFVQVGAGQHNGRATVVAGNGEDVVYAANEYATFLPDMIGQYVLLSSPSNDGKVRRITSYLPPGQTPVEHGGAVGLAQDVLMVVGVGAYLAGEKVTDGITGATGTLLSHNGVTGAAVVQRHAGIFAQGSNLVGETTLVSTPIASIDMTGMLVALYLGIPLGMWWVGESVTQALTGATGVFLYVEGAWAIIRPTGGSFSGVLAVTGALSGVVLTPLNVGVEPALEDEGGTCAWHVMEWGADLGFAARNPESPTGGKLGMLDEIGRERSIPRADGEGDASYRRRVAKIPDVVSPNAIRRACSRFFTPHGWVAELREVGTAQLPGFFYDVPTTAAPSYACAWDMDYTVRPQDRFRVWLDYADMRAFFLIGVPATGLGEFGFAYDVSPFGFYDIGPLPDYYDGFPAGEAALNKALWNDLVLRKAGGVGFDFYKQ